MKKVISQGISAVLLSAVLAAPVSALTIKGVDVPDTYTADTVELHLNGAGTRSKFFIDLYIGGLYVQQKGSNAEQIINADEPQAITLHITSGMITSDKMTEATLEGFENATGGNMAAIQNDVDTFMGVFKEEIKDGDVFELVYLPEQGVRVIKNGKQITTVGDLAFKKALYGIWLSDKPAQKDLRNKMLGKR